MKKITILLIGIILLTGCTAVRINTNSIDNIINVVLSKNNKLYNRIGKGYKYYIGVVKNNAYHHGIKSILNLIEGGVNYLAVSSLEEAQAIRKYQSSIPILCLEPIDLEFIDDVLNTINNSFAKWANPTDKKNNIIYSGEAWYDAGLNPAESLAAGHIIFPYKFCPLGVAERITFYSQIDISLITKALGE